MEEFAATRFLDQVSSIAAEKPGMDRNQLLKSILPVLQAARLYHRHEVIGLNRLPKEGRALVVVNHSLATYDIVLLMTAIYSQLGRLPRPLIDRLFFKIPYLGELASVFGAVKGSPDAAERLLSEDEIVTVAPGGMREALRPSRDRYRILWDKRYGFIRLAMKVKAPIVLAACPKADDLYQIYPSYVTAWAYRSFKIPLFVARGLGFTPLPRPVKLTHILSEPMLPPPWSDDEDVREERVERFHAQVVARMQTLMQEAAGQER